ncbi:MAG: FkbM family methyltransferase [Deltaproteobacteria bacterium]|nr:FkbM family methyltransferase [Deltaproteobacteria bacterium]
MKIVDELLFFTIKIWVKVNNTFHDLIGIKFIGIGFLLRKLTIDRIFECKGFKFFLNHNVSGCYAVMVGNLWNEPETHKFFKQIFTRIEGPIHFIDVGANIGEMVIDVAHYSSSGRIIAFEPVAECAQACYESAQLNSFVIEVRNKALSKNKGMLSFNIDSTNQNASGICYDSSNNKASIEASTLDHETTDLSGNIVVLIDIEGAELDVVKGGREFIQRIKPLIIFEYNQVSKQYFTLSSMSQELGDDYLIYRLRSRDGLLDNHLDETWNCVAVNKCSSFYSLCSGLMAE